MHIVNPDVEAYLESLLPARDEIFYEMERMAEERDFPAVGPQVGMLLEILARSINARRILELGSGFGYSGIWFASALPADGQIILTDFEAENETLAQQFFEQAGYSHLMKFLLGDALKLLAGVQGPFDIIFNDVDKEFYPLVIEPAHGLLRVGGLFITDNTLWYGKPAQPNPDATTRAIQEYNQKLKEHPGFLTVQLPLRDGLSLSIKTA